MQRLKRECYKKTAHLLGVSMKKLQRSVDSLYRGRVRLIRIPKKDGGTRHAWEPEENVKKLQTKFLQVLYSIPVDSMMTGFVVNGGPIVNARKHIQKGAIPKWTLQMDFKGAFDCVTTEEVHRLLYANLRNSEVHKQSFGFFESDMIYDGVVDILTSLVTFKGRTPQGFSTSPHLFNLFLCRIDLPNRLRELCHTRGGGIVCSIYADDITFSCVERRLVGGNCESGNPFSWTFVKEVEKLMQRWDVLKVNREKTRISNCARFAPIITGVVLCYDSRGKPRLKLPRKRVKQYRLQFHLATTVLRAGKKISREEHGLTIEELRGNYAWLVGVTKGYSVVSDLRTPLARFNEAYAQYK